MLTDPQTTLMQLRDIVSVFVAERDWEKFHSPKNISMALAVEAAELMEHFQWLTIDQSRELESDQKTEIGEEMSDVLCYLLAMANTLNIDLAEAFERKMELNRKKYPADQFRGRFGQRDQSKASS